MRYNDDAARTKPLSQDYLASRRENISIDFSVVIPTFRRPTELVEAISSVLRQRDATIEVFVIDDSPEGSAEEVIKGLRDARVNYVKNPSPTGGVPSVVRNIGWPMANGTFVHFLDDDDIVMDGHYAEVKAAFAANPALSSCKSNLSVADWPLNWNMNGSTSPTRRARPL
jgi:glycosyltransferase involved in cell wall biosynthesis